MQTTIKTPLVVGGGPHQAESQNREQNSQQISRLNDYAELEQITRFMRLGNGRLTKCR